jgi:hypothetical protein
MKRQQHTTRAQHSRRDARAWVLGRDAFVAMSTVGVVTMQATLITAKTNPRWVSGGLPREDER